MRRSQTAATGLVINRADAKADGDSFRPWNRRKIRALRGQYPVGPGFGHSDDGGDYANCESAKKSHLESGLVCSELTQQFDTDLVVTATISQVTDRAGCRAQWLWRSVVWLILSKRGASWRE